MTDKTIKVLLIEDSADDTELITRKLSRSANVLFTVTPAKNLNDALEYLSYNETDLILSDLGLPDSHGLDTVTKILCEAPHIPLIILSGFDDEAIAIKAVQAGAQDYLVKGHLEDTQIERSLSYAIERARLQRELEQHTQEIVSIQSNLFKILEKNADAIIVVGEDKKILFTNPAAEAMLGHKGKYLLDRSFDFPLDVKKTTEIEIEKPDVKTIAEVNVVEIDWEGSPAYLASLHDITRRKRINKAIRESEAKFSKAFHSSANLFAINTMKNGNFIEVNDAFTRMTGYTREEAIGRNANDLNIWGSEEIHARIVSKTRKNSSVRNEEIKIRNKSGEIRTGLFSCEKIALGGEVCFINTITDITELKQAEEALSESEEKFSKAFRHSPEVIVITSLRDGNMLEVNDTFLRLTGYTGEEITGKKTSELGIWANLEDRNHMVKTLREKGIVNNEEYQFRMKSGEIRTWLFSAEVININNEPCILSVTTDITERKKTEEALRFSNAAFNSIHDAVFAIDNDFNITHWNKISEQIYGIKASEAIGKPVGDFIEMVEDYPGQNEERVVLLLERGHNQEEQQHRTKYGDVWLDVHSQAIEENGERHGWVTLSADITERKKAEEVLRFSDAAFKSIHESVIAMDTNYIITQWNKISEQIYGIKASEAIGKKLLGVIEIVETHRGENAKRFKLLEENGYYQEEQLHRTRYGEVWVDVSLQAIEEDGKRHGWVALASVVTQRKMAEEALKRSEEKYRELITSSIDGIVSTDPQMRIIIWNQGAERIFGYKEKEMLGQSILNIIPDNEKEKAIKLLIDLGKARSSKQASRMVEGLGLRKDGTEVPIEISASSRKSEESIITTSIMRDITERKEVEEKLRESEERYRDLFENASDLIQSVALDGHFVYVNKAWRNALGYSKEEVAGLTIWDIIHPSQLSHCKKIFEKVIAGQTYNMETVFVAKDGKAIHIEGNANTYLRDGKIATRAIFRDITERKEAGEKLRESEERYRDLFENASDLIQSCGHDDHFVYVNKAWRDAMGYTQEEIDNLVIWDIVHPDYVQRCKETFRKVMTGKAVKNVETVFVTKDGSHLQVEGNVNSVYKDGKVVATRAIFRDITERKEAEEKLRQIDEMKSEFLSNVSHELRTPLQSISGFTKLIMNGQVPDSDTQQEFLQIIDRESVHLGNLINSLLDMSRLESGRFQVNKQRMPIRDIIIDSITSFHTLARDKEIELNEDIPDELPEMEIDGERIRQVVINLLSNAIKYSDPGGGVTVKAETHENELSFRVSDRGIGMSEESLLHLFERFYRAEDKLARGGTGLGLYITKQIIEAHGGQIWAESKLGEGSTFIFTLPLYTKGGNGHDKENTGNRGRPGNLKTRGLFTKA